MTLAANKQFPAICDALTAGAKLLEATSVSARLDTELLLSITLGHSRAWLYANPEVELNAKQAQIFNALLAQRSEGRPVAHLTGRREFWSLELDVNEFTLIPRPETELLVEQALERIPAAQPRNILDLGTGSGAVAIAIACERPASSMTATDRCARALTVAGDNATRHCEGRIRLLHGDWYDALPDKTERFDMIVCNPPYIGTNETALTDPELAFEPVSALYSGKDGLDAIKTVVAGAAAHLQPGGWLLLEHGFAQAQAVQKLLAAAGFDAIGNITDLSGQQRVSYGQQR